MSYNITGMRVKKLDLTLPPDFRFTRWLQAAMEENSEVPCYAANEEEITFITETHWTLNINGEGLSMSGEWTPEGLKVTELECYGDGSGHEWDAVLQLFEDFKGDFEAIIVWEGGDELKRVFFEKGEYRDEDIE